MKKTLSRKWGEIDGTEWKIPRVSIPHHDVKDERLNIADIIFILLALGALIGGNLYLIMLLGWLIS